MQDFHHILSADGPSGAILLYVSLTSQDVVLTDVWKTRE